MSRDVHVSDRKVRQLSAIPNVQQPRRKDKQKKTGAKNKKGEHYREGAHQPGNTRKGFPKTEDRHGKKLASA